MRALHRRRSGSAQGVKALTDIILEKHVLRKAIRRELRTLDDGFRKIASAAACERLISLKEFRSARTVLAYMAMKTECDPREAVRYALDSGKRVAFPLCAADSRLELYIPEDENAFVSGSFGILEPDPKRSTLIEFDELDFIIVPAISFGRSDRRRLGQGGGYYDRLLSSGHAYRCGFCFSLQLRDAVPCEEHDCSVDCIVTESELI